MARGECVAILGQNGSGKSTLVRLLSTLLINDGGEARIFGHDAFQRDARDQAAREPGLGRGELLQEDVRGREPVVRRALLWDDADARRGDMIPEILARVGFPPERRNEAMEHLSRGMQQKVALARALLTSPVLLLLDEPTTGLDPRSKLEVQEFIKEVRRLHDATILLCTHDMNEAEALADRIGILDRGGLLFLEPVEDVKRRFGVDTLEEAFFAATGRSFEEERRGRRATGGVRLMTEFALTRSARARRPRRHRRAEHLPDEALLAVGRRVPGVDDREHADDRVHRARRRPLGRGSRTRSRRSCSSAASSGRSSGSSSRSSPRPSPGSAGKGTIEYTFMAPVSRPVHLIGMGVYAVIYGLLRAGDPLRRRRRVHRHPPAAGELRRGARAARDRERVVHRHRDDGAVLPLISPEKGAQLGFIAQGLMLVVSGVYYPVSVLPHWMQWIAKISPATYALRGDRASVLHGAGIAWADVWPLLVIGAAAIPLGLVIFRLGERYAKKHGKLKRSG